MSTAPKPGKRTTITMNASGSMWGLLGLFVIASAEGQRLWPSGTSLIYLAICAPLLLIWIAYLAGWKLAERNAGLAIDLSIYILLVASLGIQLRPHPTASNPLATTLLFWAPLVSGWWAWRYRFLPLRLWALLGCFFAVLTWQLAGQHDRLDSHLILALLIALLVHYIYRSQTPPEIAPDLRDPLTGLPSPECFEAELAHVSAISDRYLFPMTLIGVRVSPKQTDPRLNDLMCQYAEKIVDRLRTADTACRWDRTTFIALLPNTTETQAEAVAAGIQAAIETINAGWTFPVTTHLCVIRHTPGDDPMSTLSTMEDTLTNMAESCPT